MCFLKSIHSFLATWLLDQCHTSRCLISQKSDNRSSPSPGGTEGEESVPGASPVVGNPAVGSPSTLFLFKAPEVFLRHPEAF